MEPDEECPSVYHQPHTLPMKRKLITTERKVSYQGVKTYSEFFVKLKGLSEAEVT